MVVGLFSSAAPPTHTFKGLSVHQEAPRLIVSCMVPLCWGVFLRGGVGGCFPSERGLIPALRPPIIDSI